MTETEQNEVDQSLCRAVLESLPRAHEHHLAVGDVVRDMNANPFGATRLVTGKIEQRHMDAVELFRKNNPHQIGPAGHVCFRVHVSEVFHAGAPGAQFQPDGTSGRVGGPAPDHGSYGAYATFRDPDGNGWLLQEVTTRLPGRLDVTGTAFPSADDLAGALRRAEAAHGQHEKRSGQRDANWPEWYAEYMVAEQAGKAPPR